MFESLERQSFLSASNTLFTYMRLCNSALNKNWKPVAYSSLMFTKWLNWFGWMKEPNFWIQQPWSQYISNIGPAIRRTVLDISDYFRSGTSYNVSAIMKWFLNQFSCDTCDIIVSWGQDTKTWTKLIPTNPSSSPSSSLLLHFNQIKRANSKCQLSRLFYQAHYSDDIKDDAFE